MRIRFCAIVLQFRIIYHNDAVCAIFCQFISQFANLISNQNSGYLFLIEICRKLSGFAKQFE